MASLRVPVHMAVNSPGNHRGLDVTPRGQHRMMSLIDALGVAEKKGKPLLSIVQEQRLCAAKAFEEETSQPTQAVPVQFADRQRLWYKEAVFYEVYVRAFCDSSGRGHGDIQGLTSKLDYLHQLGVDCLWLLPIYPSPLKDDGYDVADYVNIHPDYGTLQDFKTLVAAVHERSMRIIVDYVPNHSSDQHEWFKQSRSSPDNPYRDYYVWSDDPKKYDQARIIFVDVEKSNWTYDEQAKQYFWHRFYSSQPDLNFENPKVRTAMLEVLKFWLDIGVDGFRCDAVPFLFEREGTNCESLPETHSFLREMREYVQKCNPDAIILCEACQPPQDVRQYFGNGDEFHMGFHFPLMPRIFLSIKSENYSSLREIMAATPEIPGNCQWVTFLRNHDELTLEMVTPDERQYMWREYAPEARMRLNLGIRRRLAPLLNNDKRKLELAYSMLFTMPGSPIIYYGDEIGMGDNIWLHDRNGVRTPMQWDAEQANAGFSSAAKTYAPVIADATYGAHRVNVEDSLRDPSSLFHTIRRMVAVRRKHSAFGFGAFKWVNTDQMEIAVYLRDAGFDRMLIVNNLSDKVVTTQIKIPGDVISALDTPQLVNVHTMQRYPLVRDGDTTVLTAELAPYQFLWLEPAQPSHRDQDPNC